MPEQNASSKNEAVKELEGHAQEAVQKAQQEVEESRSPWWSVLRKTSVLITFDAILLVFFGALAAYVHFNAVLNIDVFITQEFQELRTPWLDILMTAVSYIGTSLILSILLIVVMAVIFWIVNLRLEAIILIVHTTVSSLLNGLFKAWIGRPRPTTNLVEILQAAGGKSFPSGHVMGYVAFWGLLFSFGVILFKRDRWWHYVLLIVPALFVILVGPSRVYLGDHWASDVLGAYMIGLFLLSITLWIYGRLKRRGVLEYKHTPAPAKAHPAHSS
jgi:membrane-associated phospholipid phosphatase